MTVTDRPEQRGFDALRSLADAEGYIAKVCFKTGPPRCTGVELEWTVHDADDPARPLDVRKLRTALGPHTPTTLDPTGSARPLSAGGAITIEPGGQVEISTPPSPSLAVLHRDTNADISALTRLLAGQGLTLGASGIDPHRAPSTVLTTARYAAMARSFDRRGPHGQIMMRSTAGLQICVDAGEAHQVPARWRLLHLLGPPMLAAFATARRHAGRDTGFASARMAAWWQIDPARTRPAWTPQHNTDAADVTWLARRWAAYVLTAPLLCVRRPHGSWDAPPGVTFADWIAGALPAPPTRDDLEYHISTLFPPVRPRGYLEVRYLDSQPPGEWIAPAAILVALLAEPEIIEEATRLCEPTGDRWAVATQCGLRDPLVATVARQVLDLGCRNLHHTDLPAAGRRQVTDIVQRRIGEC
jgi:glutamate--cysteine ligase